VSSGLTHTNQGTCPGVGLRGYHKSATQQGDSEDAVPSLFVTGLGPIAARARVFVHEATRAEEVAERRLRVTAPIMPGSRPKSTTQGPYLLPEAPSQFFLCGRAALSLFPQYSPPPTMPCSSHTTSQNRVPTWLLSVSFLSFLKNHVFLGTQNRPVGTSQKKYS
jgi:hypothetical protein